MTTRLLLTSTLSLFAFLISGCTLNVIRGSGHVVSETRPASNFNQVELLGSGEVVLIQGDEEGLKVEAEDNLLSHLRTEVRGHTLYLGQTDNHVNELLIHTQPVKYYVSLKTLEGLKLSGSGNIKGQQLHADRLTLELTGSGNIVIDSLTAQAVQTAIHGSGKCELNQGTAPEQQIEISGSGNYQGEKLAGQNIAVRITGSGEATIWAENALEASITGSGDVHYYGAPRVTQRVTGSGHVQGEGQR